MRPIDADALLKNTKAYFGDCIDKQDSEIIDNTILVHNKNISKIIRQAPTVERPRGEWWHSREDRIGGCSECKFVTDIFNTGLWHFCPNCGADMRGEGE